MYRVLREKKQLKYRNRDQQPQSRKPVIRWATRPNQIDRGI